MAWDVRGKTALVTGASSGIGFETSLELARRGARVLMVGRDRARTEAAVARVVAHSGAGEVGSLLCDFSSQAQVRALAESVLARVDHLHVLVNNAGAVNKARRTTVDGIETTFAVNHLGGFLLTRLLTDLLVRSAPARVVTVASAVHRRGTLDFDDLGFARGYGIMKAYARSKLANVLFSTELARRLEGRGVTSNCIHPGSVATNIWSGAPLWARPFIHLFLRRSFISAQEGARGVVALVTDPALEGVTGRYYEHGEEARPALLARDRALAVRLWDVSAALVGLVPARASARGRA